MDVPPSKQRQVGFGAMFVRLAELKVKLSAKTNPHTVVASSAVNSSLSAFIWEE